MKQQAPVPLAHGLDPVAREASLTTKTAEDLPAATLLSELEALRLQLHESTMRFVQEQDKFVTAVWNKVQAELDIQDASFPVLQPPGADSESQGRTWDLESAGATPNKTNSLHMKNTFSLQSVELQGYLSSERFDRASSNGNSEPISERPSLKCAGLKSSRLKGVRFSNIMSDIVEQVSTPGTPTFRLLLFVISVVQWFESVREPPRRGCLAGIISSKQFESLCIIVIMLNGLFIIRTANYEMEQVVAQEAVQPSDANLAGEVFFTSFYVIELTMRTWVHRLYFFCNEDWKWNLFDLALVLSACADLVTQIVTKNADEAPNMAFLRVCRVFKIAKIIRMFRALQFVSDLRMMVESVFGSFFALFWCIVLISFVLYVFALFFVQSVANYLAEHHDAMLDSKAGLMLKHFGSVEAAMVSLFQATTGGEEWRVFYEVILCAGTVPAALFIFFIAFFVVAAWNIVTSTFVEKALKIAQPDIEMLLMEKRRKDLLDAKELTGILIDLDFGRQVVDRISMKEFLELSDNERFLDFFHVRGLDIKDAEMFFTMLASVSGTEDVELSTFVAGCLRMKGLATSIDLHTLSFETKSMVLRQRQLHARLESRLKRLEKRLEQFANSNIVLKGDFGSPSNAHDLTPTSPILAQGELNLLKDNSVVL